MKWRDPKLWLGLLSLAAVLAVFALDTEHATPGPLTSTHAAVSELAGNAGCEACHGERGESMASACATCHAEIGAQLAGDTGFHGALKAGESCERCHREHHGDEVRLVDDRAFALAGVADRSRFDHAHVEFALTGVHAQLACDACHANADVERLPRGEKRFLGASATCTACHDDPHEGRFARSCDACHGQEHPFGDLANFEHTDAFALVGPHARASCGDCHPKDSAYSVEALGGRTEPPVPRACVACHDSPHAQAFELGIAKALGRQAGACCSECHASTAESFALDAAMPRDLHAATGFALDAPHAQASCAQCHGERASGAAFAERFERRREADDCAACHADPHGGQFVRPGAGTRCLDCHAREHFEPPRFDTSAHAATSFPLDGAHAQVACNDCHAQREGEPRVFRGTPTRCEQCHVDAHAGALASSATRNPRGSCAECHSTGSFAAATFTAQQHASRTSFALEGAHARASCEACHRRSPQPDAAGRTFGRAADVFHGAISDCASCHRDVHGGAFDRSELPASVAGRATCARCHSQERFRELATPFDHGRWTDFPLDGAHASAECAACHGTMADAAAAGRTLGRARDVHDGPLERCSTCHVDAHDGAFARIEPGIDCARCHTTSSFDASDVARFEHERWTGFALEGAHSSAACAACHVTARSSDGQGRTFGRAAGRACADCHDDPHAAQFAVAGVTDCARCHASNGAFELVDFDHARDTRFALDAQHARLACSACHVPWATAAGERVVRYKPLGTQCADCHGFGKRGGGR